MRAAVKHIVRDSVDELLGPRKSNELVTNGLTLQAAVPQDNGKEQQTQRGALSFMLQRLRPRVEVTDG